MAMTVLISVEGIISGETDSLVGAFPLPHGINLFHSLAKGFHIVLSSIESDETLVHHWLSSQAGILPRHWSRLLLGREGEDPFEARQRHVMLVRSGSYDLRYVVDADPRIALVCLKAGITPLCAPHPLYARSSFLPDSQAGQASWALITEHLQDQRLANIQDPRLLDEGFEPLGFSVSQDEEI